MHRDRIRELLGQVRDGEVELDEALERLATLPFVDVFGMRDGAIDEYLIYMDITPLFST